MKPGDKHDCYNCGGDGYSVEGGDCPACKGEGRVLYDPLPRRSQVNAAVQTAIANGAADHWEIIDPYTRRVIR